MSLRSKNARQHLFRAAITFTLILAFLLPNGCLSSNNKISLEITKNYSTNICIKKSIVPWIEELSTTVGAPIREPDTQFVEMRNDEGATRLLAVINSEISLVTMDTEYRITSVVSLGEEGEWSAEHFFPANEGSIFLLIKNTEQGLWSQRYALRHFDSDGRELSAQTEMSVLDGKEIQGIDFDGERYFSVLTDSEMIIFNTAGELQLKNSSPLPGAYQSILFTGDEQVMILSMNKKGMPSLITRSVVMDKVLSEKEIVGVDLSDWYDARLIRSTDTDGVECYLETQQRVYAYYPKSERLEMCFDKLAEGFYSALPILSSAPMTFEAMGFWGFSNGTTNTDMKNYGFYSINVAPRSENMTTIRVGLCCDDPVRMSLYASLFKNEYPEYEIDMIDYHSNLGEGADPTTRLNADLLSGNGPDIICLSPEYIYRYENAGVVMDLQEFVRNDSLFDSRLLLPNVWGGQGNNQSFRFLTPFFRVNGFMGKQTLISEIVTFDMDDFGTYLSSLPEDTHMIRHDTTQNLFSALYPFFHNELFSHDSGGFQFKRDEFLRLLSFCEERGTRPYTDSTPIARQFQKNETLLLSETIKNYEIFLCYAEYFGGDVGYMGAPGFNNGMPVVESDQYYGISAETKIPDAAWMFLKFLLSADIQDRYDTGEISGDLMPVLQSSFDAMIKTGYERYVNGTSMRNNLYSDSEYEQEAERIMEKVDAMTSGKDFDRSSEIRPPAFPFTEKETAQVFRNIISSAHTVPLWNPDVQKIVFEELEAFFSGQKSKEECMEILEDRLRTYTTENTKFS